jgi:hypothetical protein
VKRNRPQAGVTDAIDSLRRSYGPTSVGENTGNEHLHSLVERLRTAAGQRAADGAVVAGLAEDQLEFIRQSRFGDAPMHSPFHDGLVDHLGMPDSVHAWIPGTALFVIAAIAVHKVRSGEPRSEVIAWVKEQAAMAGLANGVATIVSILTGHELVRLPAALMTRFWIARADVSGVAHRRAQETREVLRVRLGSQVPGAALLADPFVTSRP